MSHKKIAAFVRSGFSGEDERFPAQFGMSIREYFMAQALTGLASQYVDMADVSAAVSRALEIAKLAEEKLLLVHRAEQAELTNRLVETLENESLQSN